MAAFLNMLGKWGAKHPAPPAVCLGAFGKHPGWNDHIDDLGLETQRLTIAKRLIYVQGIAGNIDSGAWDRLAPDQALAEFRHVLVWLLPGDIMVGRLWSSSDGKGRTRYPMVVMAQCTGCSLPWVLHNVLPLLARVQERCQATASAADVIAIVDDSRRQLRELAGPDAAAETDAPGAAVGELADCPALGPDARGLLRVLYQVQREMGVFRSGSKPAGARPQQLRVPACGAIDESALRWRRLLAAQLDASVPLLLILPEGRDWVDAVVGEPTPAQFFCMRAGTAAVPLTSDIPYTLDDEFVSRAREYLASCRTMTGPIPPLG